MPKSSEMPGSGKLPVSGQSRLDAYWFWGALPSEEDMRVQLAGFQAQGFHRIYIQARLSLPRPIYLSDAWLTAYRKAVDLIAGLGLKAGLYDDYAWTSGQAGGRTVAGADHLRETHVFWAGGSAREIRIDGIKATLGAALGPAVQTWIHEDGTPELGNWSVVAAVLKAPGKALEDISSDVRLLSCDATQATFRLARDVPPGASWTVFARARVRTSRIINYLLPEAGRRFVELGLQPYADALGPHLGTTVDCLFFDQPAPVLYDWPGRYGNLRNSLPWSDAFADALAAEGSVALQLAALLHGSDAGPVRARVYHLLNTMMQQAFFRPVRGFCDRHGLTLTGHEILPHVGSFALNGGFSGIDPRVAMAADFFGLDRWRDQTAVDANNLGAQLAPLLGDSLARASGRRGCWTELYLTAERTPRRAAGQWELTPAALRGQLLRLHMLGASRIILHALYAGGGRCGSSGDGPPEPLETLLFDFPPGYNLQPWWPMLGDLSEEAGALAGFLEAASPPPQVALVYPYETALREGPAHAHGAAFGAWCEQLLAHGHRPLICDEVGLAQLCRTGQLFGSQIVAVALPGEITFQTPGLRARLADLKIQVLREPPVSVSDLFPQEVPVLEKGAGVRALLAGRDEAGHWQVVLLNESDQPGEATVLSSLGLAVLESDIPAARRLDIRLAPQELRCLRLQPIRAEAGKACLPSAHPTPGPTFQVLDTGWTMQTGGETRPVRVDAGWQAQGLADWSGTGLYECRFVLGEDRALMLDLPGVACVAEVFLNGHPVGRRHHAPFRFELGPLTKGEHHLAIHVANTLANALYARTEFAGSLWPDASGLTAPPVLRYLPEA